jgi:hypothetical protein
LFQLAGLASRRELRWARTAEKGVCGLGEADGVDDGGEPGAEVGVRGDFEEIAVVGEPQLLVGAEIGRLAKATAAVPTVKLSVFSISSVGKSSLMSAGVSGSSPSSGVHGGIPADCQQMTYRGC